MDEKRIKEIVEEYIKENLTVHIRERSGWEGKYIEVKLCLNNKVIYTSET